MSLETDHGHYKLHNPGLIRSHVREIGFCQGLPLSNKSYFPFSAQGHWLLVRCQESSSGIISSLLPSLTAWSCWLLLGNFSQRGFISGWIFCNTDMVLSYFFTLSPFPPLFILLLWVFFTEFTLDCLIFVFKFLSFHLQPLPHNLDIEWEGFFLSDSLPLPKCLMKMPCWLSVTVSKERHEPLTGSK